MNVNEKELTPNEERHNKSLDMLFEKLRTLYDNINKLTEMNSAPPENFDIDAEKFRNLKPEYYEEFIQLSEMRVRLIQYHEQLRQMMNSIENADYHIGDTVVKYDFRDALYWCDAIFDEQKSEINVCIDECLTVLSDYQSEIRNCIHAVIDRMNELADSS